MKSVTLASLAIALFSFSAATLGADVPDRPPGVAANNWVPISERIGLVLVQTESPSVPRPSQPLMLRPPANGFFMLKGADGWTRLVIVEPTKGPGDVG